MYYQYLYFVAFPEEKTVTEESSLKKRRLDIGRRPTKDDISHFHYQGNRATINLQLMMLLLLFYFLICSVGLFPHPLLVTRELP